MGDEGEKVESEFIKIVPPENGWWGVETYQISLHQTEARAIAERDEIAKWLAPILRQVERETLLKAAKLMCMYCNDPAWVAFGRHDDHVSPITGTLFQCSAKAIRQQAKEGA